jgi:hypothetical protein
MGLTNYIDYEHLTKEEKAKLKKLLRDQKKALQDLMAEADRGLAALTKVKKSKKTKKSKKSKK